MRAYLLCVIGLLAAGLAACGGSSAKPAAQGSGTATTVHVKKAATNEPSESAKMICATEAQKDIYDSATGVKTTSITTPTWKDHVYSCDYVYPNGRFTLSVKEMSSDAETTAYFNELQQKLGKKGDLQLGAGGFTTPNGNAVVRKDYKVLLVDVQKLPQTFGVPPTARGDVSQDIAATIMGCWTGA